MPFKCFTIFNKSAEFTKLSIVASAALVFNVVVPFKYFTIFNKSAEFINPSPVTSPRITISFSAYVVPSSLTNVTLVPVPTFLSAVSSVPDSFVTFILKPSICILESSVSTVVDVWILVNTFSVSIMLSFRAL